MSSAHQRDGCEHANMWPPQFSAFGLVDEGMFLYRGGTRSLAGAQDGRQSRRCPESIEAGLGSRRQPILRDRTHVESIQQATQSHLPTGGVGLLSLPVPAHQSCSGVLSQHQLHSGSDSFTSSTSTLVPPHASILTMDLEAKAPLPPKKYDSFTRNLRWTFFSVYRRLSFLVLLPNVLAMIIIGTQHRLLHLSPQALATAVASNITASVLIRQELVINLLFASFGKCPQWFPLHIRRLAAKIYHLGGVHSGGAVAATVWFGLFNVAATNMDQKTAGKDLKSAVLAVTIVLDTLLVSIVILAHPRLRSLYHNMFEQTHRFAGWTVVGLFWTLFFLLTASEHRHTAKPMTRLIFTSPVFWMLAIITISLVLPWLHLRKVPVQAEPLSSHAVRIHFTYANVPLCASPRITDKPLKEWHAFAGIPEDNGVGFSIIVSKAGDWTSKMIAHPPTHLWVRGILTRGVLHVAPIFRRIVLVATGSGIGPCLALLQNENIECKVIWSTPDPIKTYRKGIMSSVLTADPNALIVNTTESGRPNLIQLAWDLYRQSDAEACFIISNARVTRKFVYGLESRGVPTFAPIFDS